MTFWSSLWTLTWFAGLAIFTILSALVLVFGAHDILALFRSLKDKHGDQK